MMKNQVIAILNNSGLSNKQIVALLDEIRKEYHNPRNVGTKGLESKPLSKSIAVIFGKEYHVSKNMQYVYYKGGWRVISGYKSKSIKYLGSNILLKFIKK